MELGLKIDDESSEQTSKNNLDEYIYCVRDLKRGNYGDFVARSNKDFLVYMVNVQHGGTNDGSEKDRNAEEKPLPSKSATNAENANRSDSVTKAKFAKPKKCPAPSPSPVDLRRRSKSSKSKIPVSISKTNIHEGTKSSIGKHIRYSSLQNIANNKEESKTHWGFDLFKKLIRMQKTKDNTGAGSIEDLYVRGCSSSSGNVRGGSPTNKDNIIYENSITNPYMDYSLTEGLHEMVEIGNKIQESECRVKDMIIKYINDPNLESELVNLISGHGKILLESERRTLTISSETWFQQAEIYKEQQRSLQNTIDTIIAQNRDLQMDYDAVVKKNETLCAKIVHLQESQDAGMYKNFKNNNINNNAVSSLRIVEDVNKHNEKLRMKLSAVASHLEELEDNLKKSQKKCAFLQQQLKNNNAMLQNTKTSYEHSKGDYELEIAKLMHDIQASNLAVKEAVEAGDVLLDDLDSMKSQLKSQSKCINWDKFKRRGKSLIDLIHLSRSCINELSKELGNKDNDLNATWQENENFKIELDAKKLTILKLETEREKSQGIVLACKEMEINLRNMTEKCKELEVKHVNLESHSGAQRSDLEEKNRQIKKLEDTIKTINSAIAEKNESLVQLKKQSGKLEQERNSFQVQVNGMTQVLSATGAGEIAKELASTQEKLSQMQAQYFSVTSDKNYLAKQMESYSLERETLIAYQKTCYEQMQLLKKDVDSLEKANATVTEQFEKEKRTVSALQAERVRHLEERTVLTAVYERLRTEVSKVDKLEHTITNMNKKSHKLAMVAQYNKKLGDRLQNEVTEKDSAISELQHNVKELEDYLLESTKEKVALCDELTQVFNIKEGLNNKLTAELERNAMLGESKKEIESVVSFQLKEINSKYEKEHWALKTLSKEIKTLASQRKVLQISNEEHKKSVIKLELENNRLACEQLRLLKLNDDITDKLHYCEDVNSDNANHFETNMRKLEDKMEVYKETMESMKSMFEPISAERDKLRDTVNFLQADVNNLRTELNQAKETEGSHKALLAKETQGNDKLRSQLAATVKQFQELGEKYCETKDQLLSISDAYDELKKEFDHIINDANRFKFILSEKYASSKSKTRTPTEDSETENTSDFTDREEAFVELQERTRILELQNNTYIEVIEALTAQKESVVKEQKEAESELKRISSSYRESLRKIVNLETEIEVFSSNCSATKDVEEASRTQLKNLEEIISDYEVTVNTLRSEIDCITTKLEETTRLHDESVETRKKLEEQQKHLAAKLLNVVQLLIAEKTSRQMLEEKIAENDLGRSQLKEEIEDDREKLTFQENAIADLSSLVNVLQKEKDALNVELLERSQREEMKVVVKTSRSTLVDFYVGDEDNEKRIESLKTQLEGKYREIGRLEDELSNLESKCALLEFERCESILRLHEIQGKMQTVVTRNRELKRNIQSALGDMLRVKDEGGELSDACAALCNFMQNLVEHEDAPDTAEICSGCSESAFAIV